MNISMNPVCKSSDKRVLELSEDIIIEILHRLPSKSLARFECVSIGFHCKVDDPEKDVISFTIVCYGIWFDHSSSVTIESFSFKTNVWTTINLPLDIPLRVSFLSWQKLGSAGVIDRVFCWIDMDSQIILYDSVNRRFWALQLSNDMVDGDARALGVSGGALYYALCVEAEITV
ncbi:hypothetical protein RND71_027378 [Anisodus tanguticus]|uniref:F-box domain-containing protein n=1 Tax=Anisodus tanguticus TaxID=243964 RepID=A0AAE1RGI7_9SOLA|nr:hypothetical protein RND71_027378 [Anisodus tanguticus]